ncbi:MAG: lytic transglycosylase domain-containing protein [Deltaproteobacteria bacterium]|nr:lytic transglycosylase domain-containing protein [Deltaproteobacteria bacterium]
MSNQAKQADNSNAKASGLTIADYLANPVRVTCTYRYLATSISFEKKKTKADKITELPTCASTKAFAGENAVSSHKEKIGPQPFGRSASKSSLPKAGDIERLRIEKSIRKAARRYKLSPSLIRGVIKAESNFQVSAVSQAGAQGLMQLMPATARELGVKNPFDIDQNIDGGSRYLRKMLTNFEGDIKLALAAYNAGPGTVRKYEGDVPYQETKQYIDRVLRYSRNVG